MTELTDDERDRLHALRMDGPLERLRVDRWHATYNAALMGLCSDVPTDDEGGRRWRRAASQVAAEFADEAHGPLVKP